MIKWDLFLDCRIVHIINEYDMSHQKKSKTSMIISMFPKAALDKSQYNFMAGLNKTSIEKPQVNIIKVMCYKCIFNVILVKI